MSVTSSLESLLLPSAKHLTRWDYNIISKLALKVLTVFGVRCRTNTLPLKKFMIFWLFESSLHPSYVRMKSTIVSKYMLH